MHGSCNGILSYPSINSHLASFFMAHPFQPRSHLPDEHVQRLRHSLSRTDVSSSMFSAGLLQPPPRSTQESGLVYYVDASHGMFNDVAGNQTIHNVHNIHNYATNVEMEVR
jgi:hypothetical protein